MTLRRSRLLPVAVLLLITVVAYLWAIRHAGYVWDDDTHLTNNPAVFSPHGLTSIWSEVNWRTQFYPLTFTTFWLQYRVSGLDPVAYHLGNVLLHAANALLLWCILRRLRFRGAFWIAAVFALHPLNVESVAWVSERKNVLSGFFYLLAALAYLRFDGFGSPLRPRKEWLFYGLCWLAFVAALLSKTVACTLPVTLALIIWWKNRRLKRTHFLTLVPMAVVGLIFGLCTAVLEKTVIGGSGTPWGYSLGERILIASRALFFYVGKFLWPVDLCFSYPLWNMHRPELWVYLCPVVVLFVIGILFWQRRRIGRGPLVAILFFIVTLSPALGFFNIYTMIYSLVADHYVYLAVIGLISLLVEPVARYVCLQGTGIRAVCAVFGLIVLGTLGVLTWQRSLVYRDLKTLWSDTVAKNPESWLAHTGLGVELRHDRQFDAALAEFHASLQINPDDYQALNGFGATLADTGHLEEAAASFQKAIAIAPTVSLGYSNLASIRFRQKRLTEAESLYQQAISLNKFGQDAYIDYGKLLQATNRFAAAEEMASKALAIDPENADAELLLGESLANQGNFAGALPHFENGLRLHPESVEAQEDVAQARQLLAGPAASRP